MFDYQRVFGITMEASRRSHPFAANTCTYVPGNQDNQGISRLNIWSLHYCIIVASWVPLGTHKKPPNMALDEVMLVMLMINDNNRYPHNH